jgi:hypothetical protein
MTEQRTNPRQRRLKEGRIVFNDKKSLMSCIVRDANAQGARVKIGEPYLVPLEFDLVIRGEGPARAAERVWIKDTEMGVKFKDVAA